MRIACIGNAVYDLIISSDTFPKEDMRNNYRGIIYNVGGPASNAASVIAKFGGEVDFYGKVGNDEYGKRIISTMYNEGINIENLKISDSSSTPLSIIIINTSKATRTICTVKSEKDYIQPNIENLNYKNYYDFILTDGKYPEETKKLIKENPNAKTIIDAGRVNKGVIELCGIVDYIICSEDFANEVTGITINGDIKSKREVYRKMKEIFPNSKEIVITIGKNGYIFKKDNEILNYSSYNSGLPAIDTNGAGDIFHGAFTYAISKGYDFYKSLEFANITASLSTTKSGGRASCPDLEEVESIMNQKNKMLIKKRDKNFIL